MSVKVGVRASSWEQGTFDTAWSSGILPHSHLLQVTFLQATSAPGEEKGQVQSSLLRHFFGRALLEWIPVDI